MKFSNNLFFFCISRSIPIVNLLLVCIKLTYFPVFGEYDKKKNEQPLRYTFYCIIRWLGAKRQETSNGLWLQKNRTDIQRSKFIARIQCRRSSTSVRLQRFFGKFRIHRRPIDNNSAIVFFRFTSDNSKS